jgi:glucose-6-phosphate isomerase
MEEFIGSEHGLSEDDLNSMIAASDAAISRMDKERKAGSLGFLELPDDTSVLKEINAYKKKCRDRFDTIALFGIGGSALGPQALKNALSHMYLNELSKKKRGDRFKVYFFDNVDPYEINSILDVIDIKKTLFLVISKSGGTTETNANFAILLELLRKKAGPKYRSQIVAITDPEKGILRKISTSEKFKTFPVPPNVGGRFSILSPVGLVVSEFMGIDNASMLAGAKKMAGRCYGKKMMQNPPLLNAVFHYLFDKKRNKRINVLMPYTRKLYLFADWYRQLWAESLGKNTDIDGKSTVAGLTPVSALGTIDQHSQLQLYLEGPNDKVVTLFKLDDFGADVEIPDFYRGMPEVDYISGKSLRELNGFEESATELVLKEASRPVASIIMSKLDAENIGEFIMFMEMQTAYAGYLYNINPYDQPAVEQGKKFTFGLLDRPGFESYKEQFRNGYKKRDKYII